MLKSEKYLEAGKKGCNFALAFGKAVPLRATENIETITIDIKSSTRAKSFGAASQEMPAQE
jgi:hypothetical protein